MRTKGTATELENKRRLAVSAVHSGYCSADVAVIFKVHPRSVCRWLKSERSIGPQGLAAKPATGRHRKLTPAQEQTVLGWFLKSPTEFGFNSELWTAPRVRELIKRCWGICFHTRYLNHWLTVRHITPQKPERQARERDPQKIARWLREDWPRIQKKPSMKTHTSS
jgi:transposase